MSQNHRTANFTSSCLAVLIALVLSLAPILAQRPTVERKLPADSTELQVNKSNIRISPAQIPAVQSPLPVLRLSKQKAPTEFVRKLLPAVAPQARNLTPLSQSPFFREKNMKGPDYVLAAFDGNHVAAYVDEESGDAEVFPSLSQLKPLGAGEIERSASLARQLFSPDIIGKDDTRFTVERPLVLNGQTLNRERGASQERGAYLAYINLRRYVGSYPVYGPGSRALLVVGSGSSPQGFVRRWKTGATFDKVSERRSREQVAQEIVAQLEPSSKSSSVEVQGVEIAYYDGNRDFLQPVYRFTARIRHTAPATTRGRPTDDDYVIGYVPIGKEFETLPSLSRPPGPLPSEPKPYQSFAVPDSSDKQVNSTWTSARANYTPPAEATSRPASGLDPTIGRYVVRHDNSNWVADANEFWSGLTALWWMAPFFTNSQYYWAEPRLFTTQARFFINSVNVGLIEVHGDWWLYSTERNCCDLVDINTIPSPGYGAAAGGSLAYWIIHSCEVVPGPDDTSHWPDPWWNIFGGVHSVVGYRTIMYIDDDVGGPYGTNLGFIAPVVSSWLNTVSSAGAYSGHPTAMAHGGINRPMGRASTISMCGRENDTVFDTSALPRAGCLRIFWYPD